MSFGFRGLLNKGKNFRYEMVPCNAAWFLWFTISYLFIHTQASCTNPPLIDRVYMNNIGELRLSAPNVRFEWPVWVLHSPESVMELEFDDLDGGDKYFEYSILHCKSDWSEVSDIDISEYNNGFLQTEIEDYSYSFNTLLDYTHYSVRWDADNAPWTKSGNYLLLVWDVTGDEKELAFTKRFLVVDPLIPVTVQYSLPLKTSTQRTHQGMKVELDLSGLILHRPREYIRLTVYQNMRWDHVLPDLRYQSYIDTKLSFDGPDQIVFPGLKEFRNMDIRSMKWRSKDVLAIEKEEDIYRVILEKTRPHTYKNYVWNRDRNGSYYPENLDYRNNGELRLEYAEMLFTLDMNAFEGKRIYVTGGYWGWDIRDDMEMQYDASRSAYFLMTTAKQGYYDYTYVLVDAQTGERDVRALEGSSAKTENDYQICVYYRDPGENYDQLIGFANYQYLNGTSQFYKSGDAIKLRN